MNYSTNIKQRFALANCFENKYVTRTTLTLCSIIIMLCFHSNSLFAEAVLSDEGATLTAATVAEAMNKTSVSDAGKALVTKVIITAETIGGTNYAADTEWGQLKSLNSVYPSITALELSNVTAMPAYTYFLTTPSAAYAFMPLNAWIVSFSAPKLIELAGGAFDRCSKLAEVNLPSLQVLGGRAFYGCTGLTEIDLPEVTTAKGISANNNYGYTFQGCTALTEVNLPKLTTIIAPYTFYGCNKLTTISLPLLETISVTSMFYNCTSLSRVDMPLLKTVSGASLFQGCTALTEISLPELATVTGTNTFYGCTKLTELSLPKLENISNSMFYNCSLLVKIEVPEREEATIGTSAFYNCKALTEFPWASVITEIPATAFYGCAGLTEITTETFPKVTKITGNNAFQLCTNLVSIELDNVTEINGTTILASCNKLTKVSFAGIKELKANQFVATTATATTGIPNITQITNEMFPNAETISGMFLGPNITSISLSNVKTLGTNALAGWTKLTNMDFPALEAVGPMALALCSGFTTLELQATELDFTAFYSCSNLKEVKLPKLTTLTADASAIPSSGTSLSASLPLLTTIQLDVIMDIPDGFFQDFVALETVFMPRVRSIGASAFSGCTNLGYNITLAGAPTLSSIGELAFNNCESITSIEHVTLTNIAASAFNGCTGLESVSLSGITNIAASTFSGCTKLSTINFPVLETIGSYAFGNCFALTSEKLLFPSVTNINANAFNRCEGLTTIGETNFPLLTAVEGFSNCVYLREANFPKATIIKGQAFAGCSALQTLNFPLVHTIEGQASTFPQGAFSGCILFTSLTDADFPALKAIGANAFYGLDALTSINLSKVTTLGSATFGKCQNLSTVELPALLTIEAASTVAQATFNGCNSLTAVTFPNATLINGFTECQNLVEVYFPKATSVGANAFASLPKLVILGLGSGVTTTTAATVNNAAFTGLATENVNLYLGEKLTPSPNFTNNTWPTAATKWKSTVSDNGISATELTFATLTEAFNFRGSRRLARKITITGNIATNEWALFSTLNPAYPVLEEVVIETAQSIPSTTTASFFSNANWLKIFSAPNTQQIGNWSFANCENLATIRLGEGFTAATNITITGTTAFNNTKTENVDLVLTQNVRPYPNLSSNTWNGFVWKSISVGGAATELTFASVSNALAYTQYSGAVKKITITGDIAGYDYQGNSEWNKFSTLNQKYPSLSDITILTAQAIPDMDSKLVDGKTIEHGLFYQAEAGVSEYNGWLRAFSAPNSVSIGSYAFYRNGNLQNVSFPKATAINTMAFLSCNSLATISKQQFPNVAIIGELAFAECNGLVDINFPLAFEIGANAFTGCDNLSKITFPKATIIRDWAFSDCEALNNITLGTDFMSPTEIQLAESIGADLFAANADLTLGYYVQPVPAPLDDEDETNDLELRIWQSNTWRSINFASRPGYLYTVTLRVSPAGAGQALLTSNGHRDSVTVKATPTNACYYFVGWDNGHGIFSSENPLNLFLTRDTILTAVFQQDSIEVTVAASTGGTVTPQGKTTLLCGSELIITATANEGYLFSNWINATTGRIISNQAKDTLTYDEYSWNKSIIAKFVKEEEPPVVEYTVTLLSNPVDAATLAGAGRYTENSSVTVEATAKTNFIFKNWTNSSGTEVSTNTSYTFTLTADITLTANFTQIIAPAITKQPEGVEVPSGSPFTLSITATGTDILYQWKKDGTDISGATSATYTNPSAALSDAGKYSCTVSNSAGSVTSDEATVIVTTGIEEYIANFLLTPNPTSDFVTVRMDILQAGKAQISLVDITGAELMALNNSFVEAGSFTKTISLASLPPAVYYIKIVHNGNIKLEKVIRN